MRVLVTGASGFLGRRLVRRLVADGMTVRALVRPSRSTEDLREVSTNQDGSVEVCYGSLNRMDWAMDALRGCDVVYHLAAALTGGAAVLFLNNVTATRELMNRAAQAGVERFVLVSSLGVYGTSHLRRGHVVDEQCPVDPQPHRRDQYTFSKVVQEQVAWEVHRQTRMPLVVIRPGVIYGPGRDCISGRVGLRLGRWLIRMGGRQRLPYTYVDNVADAVALAGTVAAASAQAFNIIDDDPPRARALLRRYRREVGGMHVIPVPHWGIHPLSSLCERYHIWSAGQLPAVMTPYKSSAMWKCVTYSNGKAKAVLGWSPAVDFDEGLHRTFEALGRARTAKAEE